MNDARELRQDGSRQTARGLSGFDALPEVGRALLGRAVSGLLRGRIRLPASRLLLRAVLAGPRGGVNSAGFRVGHANLRGFLEARSRGSDVRYRGRPPAISNGTRDRDSSMS